MNEKGDDDDDDDDLPACAAPLRRSLLSLFFSLSSSLSLLSLSLLFSLLFSLILGFRHCALSTLVSLLFSRRCAFLLSREDFQMEIFGQACTRETERERESTYTRGVNESQSKTDACLWQFRSALDML